MPAYPRLKVNGVDMTDAVKGRWDISPEQPLRTMPGRRGFSVAVPGRQGASAPRRTVRDTVTFPIAMRVWGNGQTLTDQVVDLHRNLDSLQYLMSGNGDQFPVQYIWGPGPDQIVEARCRQISSSEPTRLGAGDAADITFILEILSGDWRDPADTTTVFAYPFASPSVMTRVTALNGGTNQISDSIMVLQGPFAQFTIQDPVTGQYITFIPGGAVPTVRTGQFIRLDMANMRAGFYASTAVSFTNQGSDCSSNIETGGPGAGRGWFSMTPYMWDGDPADRQIRLAVSCNGSNTSDTKLHIRARRSF